MKKLCGLEIGKLKTKNNLVQDLFSKNYNYSIINLKSNQKFETDKINIGSLVVFFSGYQNSNIEINDKSYDVSKFKFFDFRLNKLKISTNKKITVGLAGVKKLIRTSKVKKFRENQLYKVIKPWGYELWINGQQPTYSFKKIFIKKGNQTSLQFHKKKIETNFLFKGKAELIMSKKNGKNKKNLILSNIIKKKISSGNYINVINYAVHRLKAISDIMLYEVSTPHLDDVIRIADDGNRNHGRIQSEHVYN